MKILKMPFEPKFWKEEVYCKRCGGLFEIESKDVHKGFWVDSRDKNIVTWTCPVDWCKELNKLSNVHPMIYYLAEK